MNYLPGYPQKPLPTYKNVIPAGAGWYCFACGKWQKMDAAEIGKGGLPLSARWLSDEDLARMAVDALDDLRRN